MRILPRYLLAAFLPAFAVCLSVFCAILWMNQFLRIFSLALIKGISLVWILGCFARLLPFLLSLSLPMAYLVALIFALGHLDTSGEITALRGAGFSFAQITTPFLAAGGALVLLLAYLNHKASPDAFHAFAARVARAQARISKIEVEPKTFMSLGSWSLYAESADKKSGNLHGVALLRRDEGKGAGLQITAPEGSLRLNPGRALLLELKKGEIVLPNADPGKFTSGRFDSYLLTLPLSPAVTAPRHRELQEMPTPLLLKEARDTGATAGRRAELKVEAALRTAVALSPIVFFCVGAPLGLLGAGRKGQGAGVALSLLLLLGFYGLMTFGISLGRKHPLLSSEAPYLPDAAGLAAGALLFRKLLAK